MSHAPLDPENDILRLRTEGYSVQKIGSFIVVMDIPYINNQRALKTDGILGAKYSKTDVDHSALWHGDYPCDENGAEILSIKHPTADISVVVPNSAIVFNHQFSNQPSGGFCNFYDMMIHYINIIYGYTKAINKTATPLRNKDLAERDDGSPFAFGDTFSPRYGITGSNMLAQDEKIAIIGLGGTGSYVLDFIVRAHVKEIHLFDDDAFEDHNAFRAPGLFTKSDIEHSPKKVDLFQHRYSQFRSGIVAHPFRIDSSTIGQLLDIGITSVFLCVDSLKVRQAIIPFLIEHKIFTIDCGIGIAFNGERMLSCTVRSSVIRSDEDFTSSGKEVDVGDLYSSNIQIAEMNSLNAAFAVVQWKQHLHIYEEDYASGDNLVFITSFGVLEDGKQKHS